jgi:membrane protein implicated in regulation of membrane protease activity
VGIGGSIFLLAVGAILAWAVNIQVGWLDLRVAGYVLMVAGLVALVLTIWFWNSRRRRVVTTPVPVEREHVVEERRVGYQQPPEQQY